MKKTAILILTIILAAGCAKPEYPDFFTPGNESFSHENVEISAISMISSGMALQSSLEGTINQEEGTIVFVVPRVDGKKFDLTRVKLQATVFFDAIITPSLGGRLWDVTSDDEGQPRIKLTVTSALTGKSKEYTVKGYVSSK